MPNSLPGRNNCEIEIYGMEGIPEEDVKAHEKQKQGSDGEFRKVWKGNRCFNLMPVQIVFSATSYNF